MFIPQILATPKVVEASMIACTRKVVGEVRPYLESVILVNSASVGMSFITKVSNMKTNNQTKKTPCFGHLLVWWSKCRHSFIGLLLVGF